MIFEVKKFAANLVEIREKSAQIFDPRKLAVLRLLGHQISCAYNILLQVGAHYIWLSFVSVLKQRVRRAYVITSEQLYIHCTCILYPQTICALSNHSLSYIVHCFSVLWIVLTCSYLYGYIRALC